MSSASLSVLLVCTSAAASTAPKQPVVNLHLLPHTHADVGWMQTVNSLARVNISRILDSVTSELVANPQRRFVWDEMVFLQIWWETQATPAQRDAFRGHVLARRIEFVDNGWSQHDMGCTTLDSMLNNWVEGHEWIRTHFGAEYEPRVGWSLDPFGPSSTQAVLQAYMGMDAWFFTRISSDEVAQRKKAQEVEFVWRASSSLPAHDSELLVHVFESCRELGSNQ
jgi:lysosomal alpha-mannosidase